jgi:DNA (cytosine-5)-methyltransferase 1
MPDFYEFFAGGGMARAGLGDGWTCKFANDFDHKKGAAYRAYWEKNGAPKVLRTADVRTLGTNDLPDTPDLVWASFPCQDLSLAGGGAGLKGDRSGTFWPFWSLMTDLIKEGRAPTIITLENVCGTLTSHGGKDFAALCNALQSADYEFGALVIDAALFVPQSRPRLFVIGVRRDMPIPSSLTSKDPDEFYHTRGLAVAYEGLPANLKKSWVWWMLPGVAKRNTVFADLIEENPADVSWHTESETMQLLGMMSQINRNKVEQAKLAKKRMVGGVYKRTRLDDDGKKVQRAEVRFDDVAGCLRTPAGGSSRQTIIVVDGKRVRSRLISSRETARLMGLPDDYALPSNYNEAYHLTGDGVAVPVVRHIAQHLLEPLLGEYDDVRAVA